MLARNDTTQIDFTEFLNSPLNSIKVVSSKYKIDKLHSAHMVSIHKGKMKMANVLFKNHFFYFKTKGHKKRKLKLRQQDIEKLLTNLSQFQLQTLPENLTFSKYDFNNYKKNVLPKQKKIQRKRGGNSTSEIDLNNSVFKEYQILNSTIDSNLLFYVYDMNVLPLRINEKKNNITIILTNSNNEEVTISNENSYLFSLPWSISYNGIEQKSYNPNINEFMKSILPKNFYNYDMLLGGELIFLLLKTKIIEDLKYENNYKD